MKKRLLSLMLCLTMVISMLTGITIQVSAEDDGLTPINQSFAGITELPSDWISNVNPPYGSNGLVGVFANGTSPFSRYMKTTESVDFGTGDYSVTFNMSHATNYYTLNVCTNEVKNKVAASIGYTLVMTGQDTKTMTLYKNNSVIGTYTSNTSVFPTSTLVDLKFEISGGKVMIYVNDNKVIEAADTEPIRTGLVGIYGDYNGPYTYIKAIKGVKSLVVDETANVIPGVMSIKDPTAVKVAFNGKIDPSTVNTTNAYIRNKKTGAKITSGYSVALDNTGKVIVFTPEADSSSFDYKTFYEVVVTTGIKSTGGIVLSAGKAYEFKTENPSFEVLTSLYNATDIDPVVEASAGDEAVNVTSLQGQSLTLKYTVSNTEEHRYGDGTAYVIISFENASGEVFKTVASKVKLPRSTDVGVYETLADANGTDIAESVTIPSDATVMKSYLVTADLDSYFPEPSQDGVTLPDATVAYTGDTVTVSGNGATANEEVYLMVMNLNNSSAAATLAPYTFDTTVDVGTEFGAKIQKFAKTTVDASGKYSFTIPMHNAGTVATDWRFYIGGEDFSEAQTQTFYFASESMKNSVVEDINSGDKDIKEDILNDEDALKTLGIDDNALIDAFKDADTAAGNTALIDALAAKLDAAGAFVDTNGDASIDAFIDELNEIAVFMAIENDMRDLIVDPATGEFTDEAKAVLDFAGLDVADPAKTATVTAVFENELSAVSKTAVLDALMGTAYTDANEAHEVFKTSVMVNAIKDGNVDIDELLNDNNEHFDINLDAYNNLNDEQKAQVNDALKVATLNATSPTTVASSINTVIKTEIAKIDQSVYSKTFSSADAFGSSTTDSTGKINGWLSADGWWLSGPAYEHQKGSFSDSGWSVKQNNPTPPAGVTGESHHNNHIWMSPEGKVFEGDYVVSAVMNRSGAYGSAEAAYTVNYGAASGSSYTIKFAYNKEITLYKGTTKLTSATSTTGHNKYSNAQIIVESKGYITVKDSNGNILLERYNVEEELVGGRVGAGIINTAGSVTSITVKNFLKADGIEGTAQVVDTERAPTFTGTFNFPVKQATVKNENVKILASKLDENNNIVTGDAIDGAVKSFSVDSDDGVTFTVEINGNVLDYKTDYYLSFTTGITLAIRDDGTFVSDANILFNTKAPALNITKMYDTAESGPLYFTNDMSRYREVYTRATNLADAPQSIGTLPINIFMKGLNTDYNDGTTDDKTVDIYITIEDENSTYAVTKVNDVPLAGTATESWITPTGFSATEAKLATITASSSVTADAVVKYYIVDSNDANIITLYPEMVNNPETDNGNRPSFSLAVDELKVWGNTYSGSEGKTVNMIIEDNSGVAKLVASTKTTTGGRYDFTTVIDPAWFASGTYHIYIAGQDYGARVTPVDGSAEMSLKYLDTGDRDTLISDVNTAILANDYSTIYTKITDNAEALGLASLTTTGVNLYKALTDNGNTTNMTEVAKKVAARTTGFTDTTEATAYAQFVTFVREAMAVQAYDAGIANAVHGSDGTLLLDEILHFANVNNINSSTVDAYTFYTTKLTESGKAKVRNALVGGTYTEAGGTGINALYKEFIAQTIISGIDDSNYNGGDGYTGIGHISDLITKNANYSNILTTTNYSGYTSLSETDKITVDTGLQNAVKAGTINSVATLNTELVTIMSPYVGGAGAGAGAGTGAGSTTSSVGIAGGSTISEVEGRMNFTDLAGYEWAEEAILALAKEGVVSGDGNGIFRPGDRVKREEFMKMGLLGANIGVNNYVTSSFKDADKGHWAYKIVATAEDRGITTGRPDGTFGFGEDITREEVATLIYRILSSLGKTSVVSSNVLDGFKDKGDVSDYAVQAISFMVNNGIINGVEADVLAPKDYCTRAQVAKMVYGVMNLLN